MEEWKEIPNSKGYYVSNCGRVRNSDVISWNALCNCYSVRPSQILKPTYSFGYQYVGVKYIDGSTKRERLHRLVADAFVENPNLLPFVNHIDGDKSNNDASNLEWCDASHNTHHAYQNNLIDIKKFKSVNSSQATPYLYESKNGEVIPFGSQKELLTYLGVGKTKFKSPRYQEFLQRNGIVCRKISKEEYFALEGSTTNS